LVFCYLDTLVDRAFAVGSTAGLKFLIGGGEFKPLSAPRV